MTVNTDHTRRDNEPDHSDRRPDSTDSTGTSGNETSGNGTSGSTGATASGTVSGGKTTTAVEAAPAHLREDVRDAEELRLPDYLQIEEDDADSRIAAKLMAQGVRLNKNGLIAPAVFWPSILLIGLIAVLAILFQDTTGKVLTSMNSWIVHNLGWYYMLVIGGFVFFSIGIGVSKFGKIRLGDDGEEPEFGLLSWFAMLFAAGMGIGLVFYGVGEPLTYATTTPKPGWPTDGVEQQHLAMAQTFIHWGLHPWSIYAVIGLALAYAIHRQGRPVSIRWALEPLLGDRVRGWAGDLIDILAVFGTVFGIATSLGLGVQQISSGLQEIGVVDTVDNTFLIILITGITFLATLSVVSGVGAGIKWLSNINLSVAGLLLIAVLMLGPTLFLFENFIESLGVYLANFFNLTFDAGAFTGAEGAEWNSAWTIFYWGWWISWAPFVGVFIARISRGRTVREFIAGVLVVPSLVGFFWFSVLGGAGIHQELFGSGGLVDPQEGVVAEKALFDVLSGLPMGAIMSVLAIILVTVFFITSSDSGSLVVDMLASGGHPNPPMWSRILFCALEGVIAIGLLLAGGLEALQAASLATALPFSIVLILIALATIQAFRKEDARQVAIRRIIESKQMSEYLTDEFDDVLGDKVDDRVDSRIDYRLSATKNLFTRRDDRGQSDVARRAGEASSRQPGER
ncbi:BCCT family transporter [Brevibacterium luteolum]|uniref:BCCT family transporter n=1 Tax=Brevibacterium luteolum TaxID=199591 RepID=UPI00387A6201